MIEPIGLELQRLVTALTGDYVERAELILDRAFPPIEVRYDLSGGSAGMENFERVQSYWGLVDYPENFH